MRRVLITFSLLLLWVGRAHADSLMSPHSWERVVGAHRFVMLSRYDQASEERRYPASGLYPIDGPPEPLWTVDWYAYEGEVFLSPDGEYLVRMGPWPSGGKFDELAVAFHRNGALTRSYRVHDLVENPATLPQSVSHYQWHERVTFDPGHLRLTVATIPGITYLFDAATGEILSPRASASDDVAPGMAGGLVAWLPLICWTVGGLAVAGGIVTLARRSRRS